MSDCWRGYNNLSANGYNHLTVNNTKSFVDPHTGANTQKIESNWHALKRRISRGGVQKDNYGLHFAEFLWMRKNKEDGFKNLVNELKKYKYWFVFGINFFVYIQLSFERFFYIF